MTRNTPVVVLGLGPSGLFLTRQLSNVTDHIYAVGRLDDVGMYSKYIAKSNRFYADTAEGLCGVFSKIQKTELEKPILYICSDQYLTLLIESRIDWSEYITLAGSPLDTFAIINDKEKITAYCVENEIQIPKSQPFEVFKHSQSQQFPIIVKWNEKMLNTKKNPVGKAKVCSNANEFSALCQAITESATPEDLLHVQTYIPGDNRYQFSCGGYYENGISLADMVVNQIKQYPQGISAMVLSVGGEVAERARVISRKFAQSLNFTGFLEMEFKMDCDTGNLYLLDANPRPWGWVSALGGAYSDFYKVLVGKAPQSPERKVVWRSPLRVILSRKNRNCVPCEKKTADYQTAWDIWDRNDLVPNFMIYIMGMKKVLRRL